MGALSGSRFEKDEDATWEQGDWNGAPNAANTYADAATGGGTPPPGDNRFNTNDIVAALAGNRFEAVSVLAALAGGGGTFGPDAELNDIPEPSTVILFVLGLIGLVGCGWRRRA